MIRTTFIAFLFLLADQASKFYVMSVLQLDKLGSMEIFPPYLIFAFGFNDGINFGWFSGGGDWFRYALIGFAILVCVFLLFWSRKFVGFYAHLLIGMTIGGALGNVIDRIRHEAVIDFINMSCCGINNRSIFNLADVWVFVGIIGLVIFSDRFKERG